LADALNLKDLTPLLQLIDSNELFARIDIDSLNMPKTAWISRQQRFLTELPLPTVSAITGPEVTAPVRLPSEASAAHALQRMERLKGEIAERTAARYRALIRAGREEGKSLFDCLVPRYSKCGNRRSRLNPLQVQLINEIIDSAYASDRRTDKQNAYRIYAVTSRKRYPELPIVDRKTFRAFILRKDPALIARGRGGRRCANAAAFPTPIETRDPAPTRPFERATIDHCQLPLFVVLYDRGKKRIVRQPWVTAMRDVASRCMLAVWLSLNDPSCIADAMLIRRCVRTWHRLPEYVSTDRGSDFWSLNFRSTLAHYGVHHSLSPPANSRSNSPAERPFGEMRTVWLQLRPGNSANASNARSTSSTHKATNTAQLTLEEAWDELLMFVDWFNNRANDLTGTSALESLHAGLRRYSCSGLPVKDDEAFRVSTAVDVREFKFDPRNGLRVNDRRYWSPALADRRRPLDKVKVRLDPEDPFLVYALINEEWHRCLSNGAEQFGRSTLLERLTVATQLMEGRELTRAVREECQREFTRRIREVDRLREAIAPAPLPEHPEQLPLAISRSLFDEVRDLSVEPPTDQHQEVSAYALDRIRHR
jgi:putative transposase